MMTARTMPVALLAATLFAVSGCGDSGSDGPGSAARTATSAAERTLADHLRRAEQAAHAAPTDAGALVEVIRLRYQSASTGANFVDDHFSAAGKAELRRTAADWSRYLALQSRKPDVQIASLMVQVFGAGALNDPRQAVHAQEIVVAQHRPPSASLYAQLAVLYYKAQQTAVGDRAAAQAVRLSPRDNRAALRRQLRQLRSLRATQAP